MSTSPSQVFELHTDDWRRAGRPVELVTLDGGATFTRRGGGVVIRAEALTTPSAALAVTAVEQPGGGWQVEQGRHAVGPWHGVRPRRGVTARRTNATTAGAKATARPRRVRRPRGGVKHREARARALRPATSRAV